jgi:hypothetical protein
MKKLLVLLGSVMLLVACHKEDLPSPAVNVAEDLKIASSTGIKLQSSFVTSEVAMNVKAEVAGSVSIKILDIANRVVSKETMNVSAGDNVLKVYTTALPKSAYRIALYNSNGSLLGITDFNKL